MIGDMLIAGECMTNQHHVRTLRIERAVGLIGDLERGKLNAGVKPQRFAGGKLRHQRLRIVRFARRRQRIMRLGAEFHFDHCLRPVAIML